MGIELPSAGVLTQRADLFTVAGQCRTFTELSPLRLMAAPHQNRLVPYSTTQKPHHYGENRRVC